MSFKIKSKRFIRNPYKFNSYLGLLPDDVEKRRIKFTPEIKPELLPFNRSKWNWMFPKKPGTDVSKYQLTNIGKYSIIYPKDAQRISKIIKSFFPGRNDLVITDATANMGGVTLAFSDHFKKVNAVEILPFHCEVLRNNIKTYAPDKDVTVHCMDYLDVAHKLKQNAVFFDPPWGGPDYINKKCMELYLDEVSIVDITKALLKNTDLVAVRVPSNYHFRNLLALTDKSYIYRFINPSLNKLNFYMVILTKKDFSHPEINV